MLPANNLSKYFEELAEKGWVLFNLDTPLLLQLRSSAEQRWKLEQFQEAAITQSLQILAETAHQTIRSDSTLWLDPSTDNISDQEAFMLKEIQRLNTDLRNFFRIGLREVECHYSIYKPGQFYKKHRDTTAANNKRYFSFVIYLNTTWNDGDGGELVGYNGDKVLFRILPQMGKMILFRSDIEHEVLPPTQMRFTLTGWFRT